MNFEIKFQNIINNFELYNCLLSKYSIENSSFYEITS
jgi:hypothetical protein